jgi:hypothetical protein
VAAGVKVTAEMRDGSPENWRITAFKVQDQIRRRRAALYGSIDAGLLGSVAYESRGLFTARPPR